MPYAKAIRVRFFRSTSFPERQLCSSTSFARVPRNLLIFQSASLQVLPECQFCKSASFARAQQFTYIMLYCVRKEVNFNRINCLALLV